MSPATLKRIADVKAMALAVAASPGATPGERNMAMATSLALSMLEKAIDVADAAIDLAAELLDPYEDRLLIARVAQLRARLDGVE